MYVVDPAAFEALTKIMPIDGNTGEYLGTLDTGLLPVPMPSPKDGTLYIADTRYALFSRWDKDDFISIYDPVELQPKEQKVIDIPNTRSGAMSHIGGSSISNDGRYAFSYQFAPTNAVVIVDLEQQKTLNTIEVAGCWYVYPVGERRFASRCRNGTIVVVTFDEAGNEVSRAESEPIHDPVEEPTYNSPAYDQLTGQMYLVSYWGKAFHVDLSGPTPKIGESWSLTTDEERKENWNPGGWQPVDFHTQSGQLFVLMDQRAKWAHTSESRYIWVFDTETKKKAKSIDLTHEAACLAVDRADKPYAYALSSHGRSLDIYDVESGERLFSQDELGREPRLLVKNYSTAGN
jgi:methylamine dehydrogenase heavy chain